MPRPQTVRRMPRSRRELRERAASQSPAPPATVPPQVVVQTVPVPTVVPSASSCLYTPYECSVYRYLPQWCSSCKIKAASMTAQMGLPDIRPLFHVPPMCAPVATCGAPVCAMPLQGIVTQPSWCPSSCPSSCVASCAPTCAPTAPVPGTCVYRPS